MRRALTVMVLLCASNAALAGSLSTAAQTSFLSFNAGIYIDLTPTTDLSVYAFDTRIGTGPAGSPVTLYVYTCNVGSYVGNDATAANWTQVASTNSYSNGVTALTRFTLDSPIFFQAGVTRGVLLWSPNGLRYTNSATQTFTNADLTLFGERVRNALFGGTATVPRVFAGTVNYTLANQIEGAGAIEPYFVAQDCSTLLTVNVFPATSPASTGITVTADLTSIGGSATQALFDDGTNGDETPGDNVYSFLALAPASAGTGLKSIPFTVADQNSTYNSNLSVNLEVTVDPSPKFTVIPRGNQDCGGASGINTLIRDQGQPRTAQMIYSADELKTIPVGAAIDSLSIRLQPSATGNPPPSWPAMDLNYANYDVKLSKLAAGLTVPTTSTSNFNTNIDAGSAVVVRSGPMTIPANSFGAGAAQPVVNPWNEYIIHFTTPYIYDGQDLVVTVSHDGFDAVGTRFLDAVVTTHAGFGTRFRCISANAYNATDGAALATMTVCRLTYHTSLSGSATISPPVVEQACDTLITVQVTPGTSPTSTGTVVRANLTSLGGFVNQQIFDDGLNGDVTAGDNIYSLLQTVPGSQTPGTYVVPVVIEDDQCRVDGSSAIVTVVAPLSGIVTTTPSAAPAGCPTLIEVAVTPAICSTSTGIAVEANLSAIGGSANQTLFDNGTNGDVTPNDMIYSYQISIPGSQSLGIASGIVSVTDLEGHLDQPQWVVDVVSPFANAVAATNPAPALVGNSVAITLDLNILPCAVSTNRMVQVDLSTVGGPGGQAMLDNGVAPDVTAGDNIYTTSIVVPPPACATYSLPIIAFDNEGHFDNFSALLLVSASGDPILFDGGPLTTHPGGGANGYDLSALQNAATVNVPIPMNILGWGGAAPGRSADDFVICDPAGWNISTITVYGYQTGSTPVSTITAATLRIWNGVPGAGGSAIVFGDDTTNVLSSTCWTGIYRATIVDPLGSTRPIMSNVLTVGTTLPPGRYWIDYSLSGSLASGPFTPPVTRLEQPNTGNAVGSGDGIAYAPLIDTGVGAGATYRAGLPFQVRGTAASGFLLGDMDCNGVVDGRDLSPFTGVLTGSDMDPSRIFIADVNQDGLSDLGDISAMASLLLN